MPGSWLRRVNQRWCGERRDWFLEIRFICLHPPPTPPHLLVVSCQTQKTKVSEVSHFTFEINLNFVGQDMA